MRAERRSGVSRARHQHEEKSCRSLELLGHPLYAGTGELSFRAFISIILDVAAAAERYDGRAYSSSSVEALIPRGPSRA